MTNTSESNETKNAKVFPREYVCLLPKRFCTRDRHSEFHRPSEIQQMTTMYDRTSLMI